MPSAADDLAQRFCHGLRTEPVADQVAGGLLDCVRLCATPASARCGARAPGKPLNPPATFSGVAPATAFV
ncbi:MAG: hypothetical protein DME04_16480 [Candidatus Rokuibacteriota bacterium]|nr:MAG: hypothetical protein DME04_16480 [Candidatus Rokubacteria bacterium]